MKINLKRKMINVKLVDGSFQQSIQLVTSYYYGSVFTVHYNTVHFKRICEQIFLFE